MENCANKQRNMNPFKFFQHTISIFLEFQCPTNSKCQLLYYIISLNWKIAEIESSFLFLSLRRASLSGNETWASETIWHQFHPIPSQNIMTWGWGLLLWWIWRLWWWWLWWLLRWLWLWKSFLWKLVTASNISVFLSV